MNEELFEQRESELPEVIIFDNLYQVNLKRNELIPENNNYPSLNMGDFNIIMEGNWILEGFYDTDKKQIVKNLEELTILPPHIYLIRLPGHRELDPEGHTRLHDDRIPYEGQEKIQGWLTHKAFVLPRRDALDLFDHIKGRPDISPVSDQHEKARQIKEVEKGETQTNSQQQRRKRGRRI